MSQKNPGMTVGKLRAAMDGLADEMEIVVYAIDVNESGEDFAGGVMDVAVTESHDDDGALFLAVHCSDQEEDFA